MISDPASELKLKSVFPRLADGWRATRQMMWDLHQIQIKVIDGLRTFGEQWADYSKGRLKDKNGSWIICDESKVVSHALPGQSFHNYALAIDSGFMGSDPYLEHIDKGDAIKLWNEYGRLCKANGLEWGGDWLGNKRDRPHCQLTFGLSYHELQIMYADLGLKAIWKKCETLAKCGSEII